MTQNLLVGKGEKELFILPKMANRHGLIAGATGTGKTVTLQVLAENFSRIGVPVFLSDVKGDLSGISKPKKEHPKITERINTIGIPDFSFSGSPVTFWDVFGNQGHPVRTTISEMGPLLLSRLLNLNDTQTGVLTLIFRIADDDGLLLLDIKDLRSILQYAGENAASFTTGYGRISRASVGAIQRKLLSLEDQGGDIFFGEPALNLDDFLQTDEKGRPNVVEQALIRPPFSQIGPIEPKDRKRIIQSSLVYGFYEKSVDRESTYEMLKKRAEQSPKTRSSIK